MDRKLITDLLGGVVIPRNIQLYHQARIHRSASKTYGMDQERLEHLGDAVLSLCITHLLFVKFPHESEGSLTKMRIRLVNGVKLAEIGKSMNLQNIIISEPID